LIVLSLLLLARVCPSGLKVTEKIPLSAQRGCEPVFVQIPQLDRVVPTATGKTLSIWAEGNKLALNVQIGCATVSSAQIPQLDCLVLTATGKGLPVKVESNR